VNSILVPTPRAAWPALITIEPLRFSRSDGFKLQVAAGGRFSHGAVHMNHLLGAGRADQVRLQFCALFSLKEDISLSVSLVTQCLEVIVRGPRAP